MSIEPPLGLPGRVIAMIRRVPEAARVAAVVALAQLPILDRTIVTRTLNLAMKCRKMSIPITTFMIARDPYLVQFVDQFTKANNGKAFYSNLQGLGEFVFLDYKNNKRKRK